MPKKLIHYIYYKYNNYNKLINIQIITFLPNIIINYDIMTLMSI